MVATLKEWNVFGTVTVRPGKASALAVSILPNRQSVEKVTHRSIGPIAGLDAGAHQLLFGARLCPGKAPEIAVFQIRASSGEGPDLFENPEIRSILNDTVEKVRIALERPLQPPG